MSTIGAAVWSRTPLINTVNAGIAAQIGLRFALEKGRSVGDRNVDHLKKCLIGLEEKNGKSEIQCGEFKCELCHIISILACMLNCIAVLKTALEDNKKM